MMEMEEKGHVYEIHNLLYITGIRAHFSFASQETFIVASLQTDKT